MKTCARCRGSFPATTDYFKRASQRPDGLYSWCKPCCRERRAERRAAMTPEERAAERERHAAWAREWRAEHRDRAREQWRDYQRARIADPEKHERDLEVSRFRYWAGREDERRRKPPKYGARGGHYRAPSKLDCIDPAPFVEWLLAAFPGWSVTELALLLRVPERRLRGWVEYGEGATLALIDKALTVGLARPDMLNTLYPVEVEAELVAS